MLVQGLMSREVRTYRACTASRFQNRCLPTSHAIFNLSSANTTQPLSTGCGPVSLFRHGSPYSTRSIHSFDSASSRQANTSTSTLASPSLATDQHHRHDHHHDADDPVSCSCSCFTCRPVVDSSSPSAAASIANPLWHLRPHHLRSRHTLPPLPIRNRHPRVCPPMARASSAPHALPRRRRSSPRGHRLP